MVGLNHSDAQPGGGGSVSLHGHVRVVYLMFFLSGLSALVYEVAWLSRIQLVMGHTAYALATTLSTYLAGLALGALAARRLIRAKLDPLALYVVAELLVGLYGFVFMPLLNLAQMPYGALVGRFDLPLPVLSLLQFVTCGAVVVIPTTLMGMTLPLLAAALGREGRTVARRLPALYGVNTLGAAAGALLAGFAVLPAVGYAKALYFAAGINFLILLIAQALLPRFRLPSFGEVRAAWRAAAPASASVPRRPLISGPGERAAALALFMSGVAGMLTQIQWNRLAALTFGPSAYVFPLVTAAVLLGIVAGSALAARASGGATDVKRLEAWMAGLFVAGGLSLVVGNALLAASPRLVLWVHQSVKPDFGLYSVFSFAVLVLSVLAPAALTGALFPVASARLVAERGEEGAGTLGVGYALNILGLIAGAIAGSFALLPLAGLELMGRGLAGALVGMGAFYAAGLLRRPATALAALAAGFCVLQVTPRYDWGLLTSGFFYNRSAALKTDTLNSFGYASHYDYIRAHEADVVDLRDDPHATISIHRGVRNRTDKAFKINGKVDGNNSSDLQTTRFVGLLPLLLGSEARSVLTIGLGTGSTVTETFRYPRLEKSVVVELSAAMIDFARLWFPDVNGGIWTDRRLKVMNRDGRDYLRYARERYDVVISEPSNPWVDGVGSLFTREYYGDIARRLNDGGVAALWFHTYGLDCVAVRSVVSAAAQSFPSLYVFRLGGDLYMLGSNGDPEATPLRPLPVTMAATERVFFDVAGVRLGSSDLVDADRIDAYQELIKKTYVFSAEQARIYGGRAVANLDDNQVLQYRSGRTFYQDMGCNDFSVYQSSRDRNERVEELTRGVLEQRDARSRGRGLASPGR